MSCLLLIAAALLWDASEFAAGYEVFQRNSTNWVSIGQTNGLSWPVTNLATAYGVVATNTEGRSAMEVLPGWPPRMRITNSLQGAFSVNGPWTNLFVSVFEVDPEAHQFFRGKLDIVYDP